METKVSYKLIWLILITTFFACTESSSPDNGSDIDLYASYIHPDFTQFGESDPKLKVGKEAEINATYEWIKNSSNIHTEMEEPIFTIKDSVAWIVYYWKDRGTTNGEEFSSRGKSTRIFVKENGKWLCIHGHYTLLP